jgi:hypothetical protein
LVLLRRNLLALLLRGSRLWAVTRRSLTAVVGGVICIAFAAFVRAAWAVLFRLVLIVIFSLFGLCLLLMLLLLLFLLLLLLLLLLQLRLSHEHLSNMKAHLF